MSKSSSSPSAPSRRAKKEQAPKASREGVSAVFSQFSQLLHASQRALPTENGDGSYKDTVIQRTGLKRDLKYLSMKGMLFSLPAYATT